jgi:lysine 2,3-aminomutase
LKGINDSADILENLFRKLQSIRVRPYYLFRCDPVKGVLHFSTPISKGIEIIRTLFRRISPLAIPYYAVDVPGGLGKVPLMPERYKKEGNRFVLETFDGRKVIMEDEFPPKGE